MHAHRFRDLLQENAMPDSTQSSQPLGFMACPVVLMQAIPGGLQFWQLAVYQLAFEQAQAAQQPTQKRRDFSPSMN